MNTRKISFTVLLATLCTLPAAAQTVDVDSTLAQKVRAALQEKIQPQENSDPSDSEQIARIINAEEQLQHIRSVQDSNATFEQYPDPVFQISDPQGHVREQGQYPGG